MMQSQKKGRGDVMATIKPIQATPKLRGKDAEKLLNQTNTAQTPKAVKRNTMLHNVLTDIRKA